MKKLFSLLKAWYYYMRGHKTEYVLLVLGEDLNTPSPEEICGIDFDDILDLFD